MAFENANLLEATGSKQITEKNTHNNFAIEEMEVQRDQDTQFHNYLWRPHLDQDTIIYGDPIWCQMMCLLGTENSEMSQASMSLPLVTFIGIAQRDAGKWWCLDASIPGLSGSNFRDHESVLRSYL